VDVLVAVVHKVARVALFTGAHGLNLRGTAQERTSPGMCILYAPLSPFQ
jgi:hypothetical protein